MKKKPKVGVICGQHSDSGLIYSFESLMDEFDLSFYFLVECDSSVQVSTSIPVVVFLHLKDMPGYMRGLERYLDGVDVLVCIESSRLSSFQAYKVSQRRNIPLLLLTSEITPFQYLSFPNIQVIHEDVLRSANGVIALSESVKSKLLVEGVSSEKIEVSSFGSSLRRFSPCDSRRQKFRKHIGVGSNEVLLLFKGDLIEATKPIEAILLLRSILTSCEERQTVKLILCGDGDLSSSLKYKSCDLGVANSVMFLRQNIDGFARDLFCACDFVVVPKKTDANYIDGSSRWLLDVIACGVVPVVTSCERVKEFVGPLALTCPDGGLPLAAEKMNRLLTNLDELKKLQGACADWVSDKQSAVKRTGVFRKKVREILSNQVSDWDQIRPLVEEVELLVERKQFVEALALFTEVDLTSEYIPRSDKGRVQTLLGICHLGLGDLSEATAAFSLALEVCERQEEAYVGLGQVSFQSQSFEEALTFYKKAISCDENNVSALFGVGLSYQKLGRDFESCLWLKRCLCSDRESDLALSAISQICLANVDSGWPIDMMEEVRELVGEKPALMVALGKLYLRGGRSSEGQQMLTLASKLLEDS